MKPLFILLFLLAAHMIPLHAQSLTWADVFKNKIKNSATVIWDMKADKEGNLIACGSYDQGTTLNGKQLPNANSGFLAKFDTSGRMIWFLNGANELEVITHIEIGNKGDYFFSGTLRYVTNAQPFLLPNPPPQNSWYFIGKCDSNGHLIWIRKYIDYHTTNNYFGIIDFSIDADENIYFQTQMYPGYAIFDTVKLSFTNNTTCLVKFDSSGHLSWINTNIAFYSEYITIDKSRDLYCVSQFPANLSLHSVLDKYNWNGQLVKRLIFDSTSQSVDLSSVATDAFNNVYVTGYSTATFTLNRTVYTNTSGGNIGFIFKLDSNFNVQWSLFSANPNIQQINVNLKTNYIYISGNYNRPFTLGGQSPQNASSDTSNNFFIAKITQNGQVLWIRNTSRSNVNGITANIEDGCDNFFAGLTYYDSLHFNGLNVSNPSSNNGTSVIAKFSSDSIGFINQNAACQLSLKNKSNPVYTQFQWYAKDTSDTTIGKLIATTKDLNYRFPHKGRYIITLLAIKSGGCTNTLQDTFTVPGSPVGGFSAADTQGCQYVQFNFSDTSHADTINAAIGQSWYWDFGDHSSPLTYSQTKRPVVSHVYTQSGTYTVKLVYGNGLCTDTFVSQKKVVIIPAPKPGFSVSDTVGCAPLSVNVTDGSVGTVMRWVYVIKKIPLAPFVKGDSLLSPLFSYTFSKPGLYMVHQYLTGTTGCVTEDSVLINVTPVFNDSEKTDIYVASVDTNLSSQASNIVDVQWLPYPGATGYSLYRYADNDSASAVLAGQTANTTYQDNGLDPAHHSYSYYVKAQDGCGHFTGHGRIGKTIKLSGFENSNLLPQLAWTAYKDWPGWASNYQILRQDPDATYKIIGSAKDTSYQDTSLTARDIYGECYRVRTLRNDTFPISYSNIFCFGNSPQIFIPNIFTPNGDTLNDVFAPVFSGIKSYSMTIINRWGEKVFTSQSSSLSPSPLGEGRGEAGWDGSFKGQVSPNGIYIYFIKAEDFNGNIIIKKGTVMLQQ